MTGHAPPPSIPAERAAAHTVEGYRGAKLRLYALNDGRRDAPALLWGHANGFAAGSYLPLLETLATDFRVLAFDARGHGGAEDVGAPYIAGYHADPYALDLARVAEAARALIGPETPLHFAGHSFSGYALLRLGGVFGTAPWAGITLFEPPLCPTPDQPEHALAMGLARGLIEGAERRRRRWESPAAFEASLAARPHYARWRPDMLAAHCRATLRPDGDGWTLCCPPEVEAATYRMTLNASTFRALVDFPLPVHFVASEPPGPGSPPSWAALVQRAAARRAPLGRLTELTGVGHMMPFERPDACAALARAMITSA
jgi:pimeloyl-ACP methyl ester carboxylesterase